MADRIILNELDGSIEPQLVLDVSQNRQPATLVHRIIGRATPEVTLSAAMLPDGVIQLLFPDAASAQACASAHSDPNVFELICETQPAWSMRYVVSGRITAALDDTTREQWLVSIEYQAVS